MKNLTYFLFILVCSCLFSCQKEQEPRALELVLPETPFDYSNLNYPAHFQTTALNFILGSNLQNNPISDEGATLGRVLFYDTKLSANNETSCASCHHQASGFSDPDQFSVGFEGELTRRNSISLSNTLYTRRFFWDLRANNLSEQVLQPIQDAIEMGSNMEELIIELTETEYYPALFTAAFGSDTISSERIANALTQFINSMTAFTSKYDDGLDDEFSNFTEQEELGRELFFERGLKCNQCHTNAVFATNTPMNSGLIANPNDLGLMEVTGNEDHKYQFKVPTLRNVALTAPYMHDGRFETLEEVIEHYNSGIQPYPNLDDRVTESGKFGDPPRQMNLTEEEKAALVVFLHTFTDRELIKNEKYANPFQ